MSIFSFPTMILLILQLILFILLKLIFFYFFYSGHFILQILEETPDLKVPFQFSPFHPLLSQLFYLIYKSFISKDQNLITLASRFLYQTISSFLIIDLELNSHIAYCFLPVLPLIFQFFLIQFLLN
jgi:hypothetical protein